MKVILLFLLFASGCGNKSSSISSNSSSSSIFNKKEVRTVPEVTEFLSEMNEYMIVYLKTTAIDNVIFEYTERDTGLLEAPARGYCDKSGLTPKIILYKPDWIGAYAADNVMKKSAFYHLVGHCVFNKSHNNKTNFVDWPGVTYYEPVSFMHSNFGYGLFRPQGLTPARLVDFQREFFNYYGLL